MMKADSRKTSSKAVTTAAIIPPMPEPIKHKTKTETTWKKVS